MTTPTNHWKLGLFVVASVLLLCAILVFLGKESLQQETVIYRSYFDEAVTGLEIGSPVKFRGVTVGKVSLIDVAPDRRHVEVGYELGVSVLGRLGLAADRGEATRISVPPDLRVQLGSTGVTGVKYLQIDFFDAANHPAPRLPFPVAKNHIPSTPSTLKNIEDSVVRAVADFPSLAQQMVAVLGKIDRMLAQFEHEQIPQRTASTLAEADQTFALLRAKLEQVQAGELSQSAQTTLANMNATAVKMQRVLERVDGDRGLLASAQRASDSLGDVAGGLEVDATLREVREAAEAIRELVDLLEREPDMLLKGRARAD